MEHTDKTFKKILDSFDSIELHNGDDLASCHKSTLTGYYFFMFNAKPLFGFKSFATFKKRVDSYIYKYNLTNLV